MKKETIREFRDRILQEGYDLFFDCKCDGVRYYRLITPDYRQFSGTIDEIKTWIGE